MSDNLIIISEGGGIWYGNSKTKVQQKKATTTRASAKDEIKYVHDIFIRMCDYTTDPYWQNIFKDIARDKARRGFLYYKNSFNENGVIGKLTYKSKSTKEFACDVCEDPSVSMMNVKSFMMKHAKIMSDIDKKNIEEEMDLLSREEGGNKYVSKWGEIRNTYYKNILINRFIRKIRENFKLSPEVEKSLTVAIYLGLSGKYINSKSIIMDNGEITDIQGIVIRNNLYDLDESLIKTRSIKKSKFFLSYDEESENN